MTCGPERCIVVIIRDVVEWVGSLVSYLYADPEPILSGLRSKNYT